MKTITDEVVGQNGKPSVSVIIPTKNEAEKLWRCLEALIAQTLQPLEIIVVDGHSSDSTVKVARQYGATVYFEEYGTRSGACQVGVQHAQGEFIAFTDADCIPDSRWLEILHEELTRERVFTIGGVGCQIVHAGSGSLERAIGAAQATLLGSGNSVQGRRFERERFVDSISGCHSMYTREAIEHAGGFRCDLRTCEDTELNKRVRGKVGPLLYTPRTKVLHNPKRGMRLFAKRMFQYGAGRAQARLFGVPVLLPLAAPAALAVGFVWPIVLAGILAAYGLLSVSVAVLISTRERDLRMLYLVPAVLAIQHTAFVLGFWAYTSRIKR